MDSVASLEGFERALEAEGITDAEVINYTDGKSNEVIATKKVIDGEKYTSRHTISMREMDQIDNMQQHFAILAQETARQFDKALTEMHEWGENRVKLDLSDGHSATCLRCGAEVSLNDLDRGSLRMSETAVPKARTGGYKSLPKEKIRMTLLALLKDECKPYCPNSPLDETNTRFDRKI